MEALKTKTAISISNSLDSYEQYSNLTINVDHMDVILFYLITKLASSSNLSSNLMVHIKCK